VPADGAAAPRPQTRPEPGRRGHVAHPEQLRPAVRGADDELPAQQEDGTIGAVDWSVFNVDPAVHDDPTSAVIPPHAPANLGGTIVRPLKPGDDLFYKYDIQLSNDGGNTFVTARDPDIEIWY